MSDALFSGTELQATTSISPSQGFHFIISDLISPNAVQSPIQDDNCAFYILHSFPSDVFIDPYELHQRVQDRITPSFVGIWGDTDLELPAAAVGRNRGSSILFGPFATAAPPHRLLDKSQPKRGLAEMLEIDFPLHARYPLPLPKNTTAPFSRRTHATVHVPVPALVLVCERLPHENQHGKSEPMDPRPNGSKAPPSPAVNTKYTRLSTSHSVQQIAKILNTLTYLAPSFISPFDTNRSTIHVSYPFQALGAQGTATEESLVSGDTNGLTICVPTGTLEHLAFVQPLTLLAMTLCAIYVSYTAIRVATSQKTHPLRSYEKRKVE